MKKFLIISVNYRGFEQTNDMLKSLAAADLPLSVVIVDNSQDDGEFSRLVALEQLYPNISIATINSKGNLGYMGGLNLGVRRSDVDAFDCVIMCNNDILFGQDFFENLEIAFFRRADDVLCLAPTVRDSATQKNLNPFLLNRPSKGSIRRLSMLYCNFYIYNVLRGLKRFQSLFRRKVSNAEVDGKVPIGIYAPHGSIFIMEPTFAKGGFDDEYFLYAEELTVAETCLAWGGRVVYDPIVEITHVSHSSTRLVGGKALFRRKSDAIKYVKRKYVFN